jgi:hypothetical protein
MDEPRFWQHVCAVGFAMRTVPRAQHLAELRRRLVSLNTVLSRATITVPTVMAGKGHRLREIVPGGPAERGLAVPPRRPYDRTV